MNLSSSKSGWLRASLILPAFLFFVGLFQVAGIAVACLKFLNPTYNIPIQKATIHFFSLMGTFVLLWFFMRFVDRKPFIQLGFQTKNRGADFGAGILVGLVIMASGYGIIAAAGELTFSKIILNYTDIFFTILLFIFVAFVEEILFRGYILRNLMQSMNKYLALILSSVLFAFMHGLNPNMSWFSCLSLFLAGIVLGITYIHTKNLWFPIALHFSWNFFQSLFGFNVSGQDMYSLIEFSISSPNYLNGGYFGFEGSYLSIIADVLVIIGATWLYRRNASKQL